MAALAVALILAIIAGWAITSLPPLHPAQLWAVGWALTTFLYWLRLLPYDALRVVPAVLVVGGTVAFMAGALAGEALSTGPPRRRPDEAWSTDERRATCLASRAAGAMTAVVLLAFVYQVASVYGLGAALITSATVRLAIGAGFAAVTIKYVYLALATAVLATLAAGMEPDRRRRRRHLGLFGASAASIYFSTGRGTLLLILIVGATTYFSVVGLRVSRLLALGAGAMTLAVVTIVVLGTLVGKTFTNSPLVNVQSSFTARPQVSALALPYEYLSAPVAFVGQEVSRATTTGTTHGCATLAPACAVLKAVGLDVHPETLIRPFTPPPIVWNTYTALDLPLLDGGFVFALPIVFLLGLGTGVAWGHARRRYLWGIVVYGVLSSAVVFSIGQNNFFAPHIAAAIAIALLTLETAKAWQFAARSRGWGDDMGGGRAAVNRSP